MNEPWGSVVQYGLPALAVVVAAVYPAWSARRAERIAHEISAAGAEAAKDEAAAEMRKAVAAERESASADWARFVDAKDREIASLHRRVEKNDERLEKNDERLSQAEMRALADRERADRADRLYWKAVVYLRIVIRWIKDEHPDEAYPAPPTELVDDL